MNQILFARECCHSTVTDRLPGPHRLLPACRSLGWCPLESRDFICAIINAPGKDLQTKYKEMVPICYEWEPSNCSITNHRPGLWGEKKEGREGKEKGERVGNESLSCCVSLPCRVSGWLQGH